MITLLASLRTKQYVMDRQIHLAICLLAGTYDFLLVFLYFRVKKLHCMAKFVSLDFFSNLFLLLFISFQVRQWITDRVTPNSPISPSTSSSYPGLSTTDWSTPRRERSSPLRGPRGKFVSPSTFGGYRSSSSPPDQSCIQRTRGERRTDMAELAKHVREQILLFIMLFTYIKYFELDFS